MNKQLLNVLTVALLLVFCMNSLHAKKLSRTDVSAIYREEAFTNIQAMVYHYSDSVSTVYLDIKLHHLQYRPSEDNKLLARFKVNYQLYESYNSRHPFDTASIIYTDSSSFENEMSRTVEFDINVRFPGTYILKLTLIDLNAPQNEIFTFVDINKSSKNSEQNFFLTDENEYPVFNRYIPENSFFQVQYNNPDTTQLIIRYYNKSFPISKPPFSIEKNEVYTFEPDSFYTILLEGGKSPLLELPYHGIYHFQADIADREGLTLYRFDDGFPDVSIPAQALAPLRYLTTRREFDYMLSYEDYKIAVDSFWLERSSNKPERAKRMIKRFYSRVQKVNRLFTSFQEGWKTDRGLIYIIYGPPSEVYRKQDEEEWVYGERGNPMSIKFFFYKAENPFSDNDYILQRSPVYKTSWYIAIENWRR